MRLAKAATSSSRVHTMIPACDDTSACSLIKWRRLNVTTARPAAVANANTAVSSIPCAGLACFVRSEDVVTELTQLLDYR
jgi:hypothetical protein